MKTSGSADGTRVELYARSTLPDVAERRRDEIVNRFRKLAAEGHFSTVEVHAWQKKVPLDEESRERRQYDEFAAWTADVGVDLDPFFDTRECYSMASGDLGEQLVLPALCIAIYRGDELQSVYPHSTPTGSRTVMDCVQAIEDAHVELPTDEASDLELAEPAE
jgi:hypothetical protein